MYVTEFILCVSIFFLLFTGCIWIIYAFQTRSKKELILTKNYSNMTYEDFFKYIDFLMDMELYFHVLTEKLPQMDILHRLVFSMTICLISLIWARTLWSLSDRL